MLLKTLASALLCLVLSAPALAETRYISDDLYIYMHSGPSNQFRILGSIDAGSKVNVIDYDSKTKYSKIKSETGREGWVEAKYLNNSPGLAIQLETIKKQLEKAEEQHLQQQQQLNSSNSEQAEQLTQQSQKLRMLQQENEQLSSQLTEITDRNNQLQSKLDKLDEALLMQWFLYGGLVAGIGLILGLLLPLIPRRKKQVDRWM